VSEGPDQARELARAFAATLRRLQTSCEVGYVPAGPMHGSSEAPDIERSPESPAGVAAPQEPNPEAGPDRRLPVAPVAAAPTPAGPRIDERDAVRAQAASWAPATKLEYLRRKNVGDCKRCPLCRTRTNIVFGVGSAEAHIMFVGEAPGADEDRQGEPFVGRAGQRLTQWIEALGLRRDDVYIANVLKCRPPGNRDPRPEEVEKCSPFLQAQIRAIRPKVIVALGRHAGMLLSRREDMTLRAMRSSRLTYDTGAKDDAGDPIRVPLVVTYHPAYVLRQEGSDAADGGSERASPDEMVMGDLRRALDLARAS
jgi:uracil-DNA glycosylase family 4